MAEHLPRLLSDFLSLTNTIQNSLKERDVFWLTASVVLAHGWAVSMLEQARAPRGMAWRSKAAHIMVTQK